jgi:hypothetical protein
MRKSILIVLGGLLATGCASSTQQPQTATLDQQATPPAAIAMTMAFTPQVNVPTPVLDRDSRELAAAGGFDDAIIEVYDVQTDDDQQYFNYPGSYERRVLSDRTGVIFH